MELNAEQIKKALECCANKAEGCLCSDCPFVRSRYCTNRLRENALALIKELTQANEQLSESYDHLEKTKDELLWERSRLTEENERLKKSNTVLIEDNHILSSECIPRAKADTVRKMHFEIKERCIKGGIYPAFVARTIDQIAKEMLEGDQ